VRLVNILWREERERERGGGASFLLLQLDDFIRINPEHVAALLQTKYG